MKPFVVSIAMELFFFSWCGLKDGHLEGKHLISSMTASAVKRICDTDVLIIDEISMVSQRTLEQVW